MYIAVDYPYPYIVIPRTTIKVLAIAKVNDKYSYLGKVEKPLDGLDGRQSVVETCSRLLQIFSSVPVCNSLERELDLVNAYSDTNINGSSWLGYDNLDWNCRWPFIETCLLVGTSSNPETGEQQSAERVGGESQWDYSTLLIIFDLTNPIKLRYCLVERFRVCRIFPFTIIRNKPDIPPDGYFKAWSLSHYIDKYNIPLTKSVQVALDRSKTFDLIDYATLRSLCPDRNLVVFERCPPSEQEVKKATIHTGPSSLVDMTIKTFVDEILQRKQCEDELLESFVNNHSIRHSLRRYLEKHAKDMRASPVIGYLLKAAFAETKHLNLVPWICLSVNTIVDILQWDHIARYVEVVSISSRITGTNVEALANALPARGIKDIYIFSGPVVHDICLDMIYFNQSLSSKVKGRIIMDKMFSRALMLRGCYASSFRAPDCPVLQIIYQNQEHINAVPMEDAMLSPVRLVSGLFNLLRLWLRIPQLPSFKKYHWTAVQAFASAPSSLEDPSQVEITCFPRVAYYDARLYEFDDRLCYRPLRIQNLDQGTWTVLLVLDQSPIPSSQHPVPSFKVGLITTTRSIVATPKSDATFRMEDLILLDLEGFVRATAPDAKTESLEGLERSLNELRREMYGIEDNDQQFLKGSLVKSLTMDEAFTLVKGALLLDKQCVISCY